MAVRARVRRSPAEEAAYGVLAELGFPLPLGVDAARVYMGLELRREAGLPAGVRGLLDVRERLIVVPEGLPPRMEEHVVLHEGGHYHLPHHRALFYRCSPFDLDVGVRRRLEAEANTFATVLRFGSVPDGWVDAEPPSISRVRALADMAGASFESALRWFVGAACRPLWALVCDPATTAVGEDGTEARVRVRYGYRSPAARPEAWPEAVASACVQATVAREGPDWPPELAGYRAAGATAWDAYATAYWTCVLMW